MFRRILLLVLFSTSSLLASSQSMIIIDSDLTLDEALIGTSAPGSIIESLTIVNVEYYSTDSALHRGQLVINRLLRDDIIEVFEFIKENKIIIDMVIPIRFDLPNNGTSMANLNNSYSFHYRDKVNKSNSFSMHAFGMAIDINPFDNPYISSTNRVLPQGAVYNTNSPKSLTQSSALVQKFLSLGWTWGGNWSSSKDYMHFEKSVK